MPTDRQGHDDELVPEDDTIIGKAFRWSLAVIAVLAVGIVGVLWLMREEPQAETVIERGPVAATTGDDAVFGDTGHSRCGPLTAECRRS